ncbi:hypothetical protein HSX10_14345 [Winogradskyella undariae]|uniref:hypothetical protein n=1 Tax=Winogradskyella undariae TaxID=1285465 RepID=UPI00156B45A4|nr:hypothetical protein [Winogradskyella undariae]NRR92752.1 hypothetical protein [Winogradskyella undariae]
MKFVALLFFVSSFCFGQKQIEINFQTENDSTLIQYLKENKIDFSINQIATLKGIRTFGEYSRSNKLVVPEAYFYNSNGELIKNRGKGTYCGAEIKKIAKISKMKSDPNQTLQGFLKDIVIIDKSEFIEERVDVYIVITWAKFLSEESQTSLNWFSSLIKQDKLKIKFLLLNLDIQESWRLTDDQKKYLGII